MNRFLFLLIGWFIGSPLAGFTQPNRIHFNHLSESDGLSQSTVKAIYQDSQGFLWLGTQNGLNKYDGAAMTLYRHNSQDSNSISNNEITVIFEDRSHILWVGTAWGLNRYDRSTDRFIRYVYSAATRTTQSYLSNERVEAIAEDKQGQLWIATYMGGLNRYDRKKSAFTYFRHHPNDSTSLSDDYLTALYVDMKGALWIGTRTKGLDRYDPLTQTFHHIRHNPTDTASLSHNRISAIRQGPHGELYIGTFGGLNVMNPTNHSFKRYLHQPDQALSLSSNVVFDLIMDRSGKLWVGVENGGLNRFDPNTDSFIHYKSDFLDTESLSNNTVLALFEDQSGIIWVGVKQGGVNYFHPRSASFQHIKHEILPNSLSHNNVTAFQEDRLGNIWIGTDGGGVNRMNPVTKSFTHYRHSSVQQNTINSDIILALLEDRAGKIWMGTFGEGVSILNPSTGKFTYLKHDPKDSNSLSDNRVNVLLQDRQGQIWMGTTESGLTVYDPLKKCFTRIQRTSQPSSLIGNHILSVYEDRKGYIWVGAYGGVSRYNPTSRRFIHYTHDPANVQSLSNNEVSCFYEDQKGFMWMGTANGLNRWNPRNDSFTRYTTKDGLPSEVIQAILEDKQGNLWLSTLKGLARLDGQRKRFTTFSGNEGIQAGEFNKNAALKTRQDMLFFGGYKGFTMFRGDQLRKNPFVPPVVLTGFRVFNEPVSIGGKDSPLQQHISQAKQIHLSYHQNVFSFEFAALNFLAAQQNQYAYRMEGFDKKWTYVGNKRSATYTNLDPGTYVFRVKAANNDGVWNQTGTSITLIISPPFWKTHAAYALYIGFALGSILFLRARGIRKLKRGFEEEQNRKEEERKKELDQLKLKFLTNLSHEFRTPISLILAPADKLLHQLRDQENSGQVLMIKRNAHRLLHLVNQLLDFRKMEQHELKLHASRGEIISFLKDIADSFLDLAERKNIAFSFSTSVSELPTVFDTDKMERVLFNLLSNAFKFTSERGSVHVAISQLYDRATMDNEVWLEIKVIDTGIGIAEDRQQDIFKLFFQAEGPGHLLNQGSGIGLSITKEFVKMQGGEIYVESKKDKGSTFIVHLPFPKLNSINGTKPDASNEDVIPVEVIPEPALEVHLSNKLTLMPHLLLVEDNLDFRFYLKDNLKGHYKITEAENGREGWQKALALHPHLIVSDISMPLMDGKELCMKLKSDKRTRHIPVILLTATTGEDEQIRGLQTGANDYLTKPFNFEVLHSKIRNLLVLKDTFQTTYTKQIQVNSPTPEIESEDARLLSAVVRYLEENLTDTNLSVENLGKFLGVGRTSLYRKILEITGETPVEFIRSYKLEKAKHLLEHSDYTIAQVCYTTGFSTPTYFTKAFKAKYHLLPSEYIQLKRKQS